MPRYKNLAELVLSAGAACSNDIALRHIQGGRVQEFRYGDLPRLSHEYAQALYARGIRTGNRIAIWADDSPQWVIACIAAFRLGAVIIPIDPSCQLQELQPIWDKLTPDLVIADDRQYLKLSGSGFKTVLLQEIASTSNLQALPHLPSPAFDEPVMIALSTGTTGPIEAVELSHGDLLGGLTELRRLFPIKKGDRFVSLVPRSNLLGFSLGLLVPLGNGCTLVFAPLRNSQQLLQVLSIEKVKAVLGSPPQLERLLDALEERINDLSRSRRLALSLARQLVRLQPALSTALLRPFEEMFGTRPDIWISGLAPVPKTLSEKICSFGLSLVAAYSPAETSPVVALAEVNDQRDNARATVSSINPVIDNPEASNQGHSLLQEIQSCLNQSPWVKESCVFNGKEGASDGVYAAIIPSLALEPRLDKEEKLRQVVIEQMSTLPDDKRLSGYQLWEHDLPRTIAGDIKRSQVMAVYESRRKQKSKKGASKPDDTYIAVCNAVAEVMDPEVFKGICPSGSRNFSPEASLTADLGLDSFARLQLSRLLAESLCVNPSPDAIERAETVEDLVVIVKAPPHTYQHPAINRTSVAATSWPRAERTEHNWPYQEDPWAVASRMLVGIGLRTCARIYNDFETAGADRLVIDPPYIIAANHHSNIDILALLASFPPNLLRHVHPITGAEHFFASPVSSALSSYLLNAVPFDKMTNLQDNLDLCAKLLRNDKILVMFPEEDCSPQGQLGKFKSTAAYLSIIQGCPIIPAYIDGSSTVSPAGSLLPKAEPLHISFGLPIYPPLVQAHSQSCRELTARVRQAIQALAGEPAALGQPAGS